MGAASEPVSLQAQESANGADTAQPPWEGQHLPEGPPHTHTQPPWGGSAAGSCEEFTSGCRCGVDIHMGNFKASGHFPGHKRHANKRNETLYNGPHCSMSLVGCLYLLERKHVLSMYLLCIHPLICLRTRPSDRPSIHVHMDTAPYLPTYVISSVPLSRREVELNM